MKQNDKDWTDKWYSWFKMIGASNHTEGEREQHDFYATDPKAIDALLDYMELPGIIWEPSCGEGHLSKRLEERGYNVISSDLVERGYGVGGVNFFEQTEVPSEVHCILTNPPYKYAAEYIVHALKLLKKGDYVCMFVKTTFAEGQGRYNDIYSINPPKFVLQFVRRLICSKNGNFEEHTSSAVSYAWFVWEKGYKGKTVLDWIYYTSDKNKKCEQAELEFPTQDWSVK